MLSSQAVSKEPVLSATLPGFATDLSLGVERRDKSAVCQGQFLILSISPIKAWGEHMRTAIVGTLLGFCLLWGSSVCDAAPDKPVPSKPVHIAVASNFLPVMQVLAKDYQTRTGKRVIISAASTGKLYAQLKHGAPFDIFFSADASHAARLVNEQLAVAESLQTYAIGRLVMVSHINMAMVKAEQPPCHTLLEAASVKRIAIANPQLAPYGMAAQQTLTALGLWQQVQAKLVRGENIAQTFQFFDSGNAAIALIAKSQLRYYDKPLGCVWQIPEDKHLPIEQKRVVLKRAVSTPAVNDFLAFMQSDAARAVITTFGYQL